MSPAANAAAANAAANPVAPNSTRTSTTPLANYGDVFALADTPSEDTDTPPYPQNVIFNG